VGVASVPRRAKVVIPTIKILGGSYRDGVQRDGNDRDQFNGKLPT
jgi:hypothetical protein